MANWYSVAYLDSQDEGPGWYVLEEETPTESGYEIAGGPYETEEEAKENVRKWR